MAWTQLKNAINNAIKANNNQEITGQVLNSVLNTIVNSIGKYATFAGIATPGTNPGLFEGPIIYFASTAGIYPNFGNITVKASQVVALYNIGGSWESYEIADNNITTARIADKSVTLSKLSDEIVNSSKAKNRFNPNDPSVKVGYYLNQDGDLIANNSYTVSGYIPFSEKDGSLICSIDGAANGGEQ